MTRNEKRAYKTCLCGDINSSIWDVEVPNYEDEAVGHGELRGFAGVLRGLFCGH